MTLTPTLKRKLRARYRALNPPPVTPSQQEQEAIRVIASLNTEDVLDLARPGSAATLSTLIREIIA
jgi:hypothetical protein